MGFLGLALNILLASLPKIEAALKKLSEDQNLKRTALALQAVDTLTSIKARESINGTDEERNSPDHFADLTEEVRVNLDTLKTLALKSGEP